ncbi:MAG: hypothetical protein MRJ65_06965 [Candidatus Brocadiaceae bacterium]|nr:hypothetical protein [Candidatus Brocadiaceae bacterium]
MAELEAELSDGSLAPEKRLRNEQRRALLLEALGRERVTLTKLTAGKESPGLN